MRDLRKEQAARWYADALGESSGPFPTIDAAAEYVRRIAGERTARVDRRGTVYRWASYSPGMRARITLGRVYPGRPE